MNCNNRVLLMVLVVMLAVSLSGASLLAEEPMKWPEKLPDSILKLKQAKHPKIPSDSNASLKEGLERLKQAMRPDSHLKSGTVVIETEKFLPPRLQRGRVPQILTTLTFDTQVKPSLWAQWTSTAEKNCAFVRSTEDTFLSESFPTYRGRQRISIRKKDYIPTSKYCDLFPVFSLTYVPHFLLGRPQMHEIFVQKSVFKEGQFFVEKQADGPWIIHKVIENSDPQSMHKRYHAIFEVTADETCYLSRMIFWSQSRESGNWKVNLALNNDFVEVDGVKVPGETLSYLRRTKGNEDEAQRLTLTWKDVNKPCDPKTFNEKLLEPTPETGIFDLRQISDGVVGVPYGEFQKTKGPSDE
ncbi:hypothetical protein [Gimesia maris]|uniref:Outer membrane lipoprotein-sorting protein n=1 Tax=Gimesia maris TaxID=122 RepID=A0ABX5YHD7_9PLAN|nr:hypothetical protein [Gimesia maris]EDL59551.1 hypothetical protein PM8797T_04330 [Gimesia maris DSM 8797]QEG15101.1 hypothetical protein GmarT_09390 [Gimesia maris]QGQ31551.1 hypothetical protein F1729_24555 [Gimesia maris]